MNMGNVIQNTGLTLNRMSFDIQKKSPEILVVAGVVGLITAAVMACKATTKAGAITEKANESLAEINEAAEKGVTKAGETYTEEDRKKDISITRIHTFIDYAKLYGPWIALAAGSTMCIFASHNMMNKRNIALAAAYTGIERTFNSYRERVLERFGEQAEKELRYNIKAKEIERTVTDENGNEKVVREVKNVVDHDWSPSGYSMYAREFNESNPGWCKNSEQTKYFLKALQAQANDMLKAQGHLFLNDVYALLRYPLTDYGQVVGWIYDIKNPRGDNFVDFGFYEIIKERDPEIGGEYIAGFILDFNPCGNILNDLKDHQY